MEKIFNVNNIYIKEFSYSTFNLPNDIMLPKEMQANMNINVSYSHISENFYEVVVNCVLDAKRASGEDIYLLKISKAGIFTVQGFEGEEKEQVLRIHAASVLFPYLRERVYNVTGFSGIGNGMILPTVDFSHIYEIQKEQNSNPTIQ